MVQLATLAPISVINNNVFVRRVEVVLNVINVPQVTTSFLIVLNVNVTMQAQLVNHVIRLLVNVIVNQISVTKNVPSVRLIFSIIHFVKVNSKRKKKNFFLIFKFFKSVIAILKEQLTIFQVVIKI